MGELLYGKPLSVGDDAERLCDRLKRAKEFDDITQLGKPKSTVNNNFVPSSAHYECPLREACPIAKEVPGLLPGCSIVLNTVIDNSAASEVYELPPQANEILKCEDSLIKDGVSVGQQG